MTTSPTILLSPVLADIDVVHLGISFFLLVFGLSIIVDVLSLIHNLFSLPMRRAERARFFLDVLEDALNRGQSIEETLLSLAQSRDQSLDVGFYLLTAHIESGLKFVEALKKVPRFLPPQIAAMFLAGEKLGDLKKVLPACREILRERPAGVRSAVHYLLLVVLFFSPAYVGILWLMTTFVMPRFKEVAAGMGTQLWPVTLFLFNHVFLLCILETGVSFALLVLASFYIGGPQSAWWFRRILPVDRIAWLIPWKRKRLQRTFSAMLAVLLDGGVPEAEAVRLAGDCTANEICRRLAQRIINALQQGAKLDSAVKAFDDKGEFHWRLANAAHAHGGFLGALRGWHETLDAKAFQQEEAAAHAVTTGIVVLNGLLVALFAIGTFAVMLATLYTMLDL